MDITIVYQLCQQRLGDKSPHALAPRKSEAFKLLPADHFEMGPRSDDVYVHRAKKQQGPRNWYWRPFKIAMRCGIVEFSMRILAQMMNYRLYRVRANFAQMIIHTLQIVALVVQTTHSIFPTFLDPKCLLQNGNRIKLLPLAYMPVSGN
jgi:hypothetical protein